MHAAVRRARQELVDSLHRRAEAMTRAAERGECPSCATVLLLLPPPSSLSGVVASSGGQGSVRQTRSLAAVVAQAMERFRQECRVIEREDIAETVAMLREYCKAVHGTSS